MTDTVYASFKPVGAWSKDIYGIDVDEDTDYNIMLTDTALTNDKRLGMVPTDFGMQCLVLRLADDNIFNPDDIDQSIAFYGIGNYDLPLSKTFALEFVYASSLSEEEIADYDTSSLGVANCDDVDRAIIIYCKSLNTQIEKKIKPAFDPIFFGDMDHELKDPKLRFTLWMSTLGDLKTLDYTGTGKTGYNRLLPNDTWKPCGKYRDVLDAAEAETGINMYQDFLNNPQKFPTIKAEGKGAFIRRRDGGTKRHRSS